VIVYVPRRPQYRLRRISSLAVRCAATLVAGAGAAALIVAFATGVSLGAEAIRVAIGG
jgi:hypothetical protein